MRKKHRHKELIFGYIKKSLTLNLDVELLENFLTIIIGNNFVVDKENPD